MSYPTFEPGDTMQFTWASSVAPDAAPIFKISMVNCAEVTSGGALASVIASVTAVQSDTTHYYALFTMPTSPGYYMGQWDARKTVSGSAYNVLKHIGWKVQRQSLPPG